jgi:hypothetical protein
MTEKILAIIAALGLFGLFHAFLHWVACLDVGMGGPNLCLQ